MIASWRSGLAGAVVALALGTPTVAEAAFTTPALVSGGQLSGATTPAQSDYAYDPALSGDGNHVVFTGSVDGVRGVFLKTLSSGALQLVAGGDAGAAAVSGDGRYVSFTTSVANPATMTAAPVPGPVEPVGCTNVWVRDMTLAPSASGAFAIASARSASTTPLTYVGSAQAGCPGGGAESAARAAISADGHEVAFTVVGQSNLTDPTPVTTTTPSNQVAMRNLATGTTTLVSVQLGTTAAPVPDGAAMSGAPSYGGAPNGGIYPASGSTVAISGDGSTVAWLGMNLPQQTPTAAPAGTPSAELLQYGLWQPNLGDYVSEYDEPLWRRVADGAATTTRRILGGQDPQAGCGAAYCAGPLDLAFAPAKDSACGCTQYGSLINAGQLARQSSPAYAISSLVGDGTPALSADGREVAVLSTAPTTGHDPDINHVGVNPPSLTANAFVVNMAPGLDRTQATTRLTDWASSDFKDAATTGGLGQIAISPDGTRVAFATARNAFPLSPPTLVTAPVSAAFNSELYEVDLRAQTLSLVTSGFDGLPGDGFSAGPSFSADGNAIAFESQASNLAFGTGNGQSNVFVTSVVSAPSAPSTQLVSAPPPLVLTPAWRLGLTVLPGPSGSLRIDATVPGAGSLRVVGSASMAVKARAAAKRKGRSHNSVRLVTRPVASAGAIAGAAQPLSLLLRPDKADRSRFAAASAPSVQLRVTFTATGHPPLTQQLQTRFPRVHTPKHASPPKKKRAKTGSKAGRR